MAHTELVLGIDIGGTNTTLGYIDRTGRCRAETTMLTLSDQPPASFFKRLHEEAEALWKTILGDFHLAGIGIGAPNGNYYRGTIETPPNLSWTFVDVRAEMARYWQAPLAITNDANAAAFGELLFGSGKGMRDFIVITLGTGLGSGVVVNGELVHGHSGFAGEIGHTIVQHGGRLCGCGLRGCLETYASATGLLITAKELLAASEEPSLLRAVPNSEMTSKSVYRAALEGDALAHRAFDITGTILGRKLADSVAHTSPEAIFLFGGLTSAGELIFEPTRKALEENLYPVFRGTVKLLPSGIPMGQTAIIGAAAMMWKQLDRSPAGFSAAWPSTSR
jgi:glucokinase